MKKNRLNPKDYKAMFELHIEQGPILEAANNDIGVVTCVLGMINYRIKITGQADHAGTTPMKYRHDAHFASYMLPTTMILYPQRTVIPTASLSLPQPSFAQRAHPF